MLAWNFHGLSLSRYSSQLSFFYDPSSSCLFRIKYKMCLFSLAKTETATSHLILFIVETTSRYLTWVPIPYQIFTFLLNG